VYPPSTENDPSPPILVNIGDLLSYWTNGYFKSTVHRVVFPHAGEGPEGGEDRYSIAFFGHPVGDCVLEAVPSEVVSRLGRLSGVGPENNDAMTADEHLMSRLKATYLGLYRDGEGKEGEKEDNIAAA
jgi:isopenicillin N synthase-like dioxygenase